jgi:hypothetical protein
MYTRTNVHMYTYWASTTLPTSNNNLIKRQKTQTSQQQKSTRSDPASLRGGQTGTPPPSKPDG